MGNAQPIRSVNSSSKLAQRKACPGSANAEAGLPRIDNAYSEEGTMLHACDADPSKPRDALAPDQQRALTRNEELRKQFLEHELPRLGISPEAKCIIMREREFVLCDEDGEPVISHGQPVVGHPDLIYWYPDFLVAIIFDSKFGRIQVTPAWMNLQLKCYFVMFCERFNPETVIVAITQPWASKPNDFHSAEYAAKDAPAFKQEIVEIIRATEPSDAPRFASIEACTYCLAVDRCSIAITAATEMAVVKCNDLTPEQLEDIGQEIKLAELVIAHWYKRMKYLAEKFPQSLTRYALKSTGTLRTFTDTAAVFDTVVNTGVLGSVAFGEQLKTFLGMCKLSAPAFEEFVAKTRKLSDSDAALIIKEALGPLMIETEKEKSLVKIAGSVHKEKVLA